MKKIRGKLKNRSCFLCWILQIYVPKNEYAMHYFFWLQKHSSEIILTDTYVISSERNWKMPH